MARRGMVVRGAKALTAKIKRIEKAVKKHISVPVMRAAGKETAKVIKSRMASRYKDARKSIGWRMRKASENPKNIISAKAGAGVGFRGKRRKTFLASQAKRRQGRKGVGTSPQNIHWWFLGTTDRRQKSTGRFTGRQPTMESPVQQLANTGRGEIFRAQVRAGILGFKKLVKS